jgi:hypothetical protein
VKVAPLAGWVSVTAGPESPRTCTIRATDGTPLESMMNSM